MANGSPFSDAVDTRELRTIIKEAKWYVQACIWNLLERRSLAENEEVAVLLMQNAKEPSKEHNFAAGRYIFK